MKVWAVSDIHVGRFLTLGDSDIWAIRHTGSLNRGTQPGKPGAQTQSRAIPPALAQLALRSPLVWPPRARSGPPGGCCRRAVNRVLVLCAARSCCSRQKEYFKKQAEKKNAAGRTFGLRTNCPIAWACPQCISPDNTEDAAAC